MAFARKRGWRDWFQEVFIRQGLFSLRPLPANEAEAREQEDTKAPEEDITRLNLDSPQDPRR